MTQQNAWKKIIESGTVKLVSVKEPRKIKKQLAKKGKSKRILPGVAPTKKSRLLPTRRPGSRHHGNRKVRARCQHHELGSDDAICCQSRPLERKQGPVYSKQPPEGIEGVDPGQIALIIAGCYGLVDAPLHWSKSLTDFLSSIGYQQSKLDSCLHKLTTGTNWRA